MPASIATSSTPLFDYIRLLGLLVLGYAAYRDYDGRIPNILWAVLLTIGILALGLEVAETATHSTAFFRKLLTGGLNILLTVALGFGGWRAGWIGGADSKALICLGVLFPWTPSYIVSIPTLAAPLHFPLVYASNSLFTISTIVINIGFLYLLSPLYVSVYNTLSRQFSPHMFTAVPRTIDNLLDVDGTPIIPELGDTHCSTTTLREYCRWQNTSLAHLIANPDQYRHPTPTTEPETSTPPGFSDEWRAVEFVQATHPASETVTPSGIRTTLSALADASKETYWVRPYLPITPWLLFGTVLGITLGNALWTLRILL